MDTEAILADTLHFCGAGESRSTGPWVKMGLNTREQLAEFRGLDVGEFKKTGHVLEMAVKAPRAKKAIYNDEVQLLDWGQNESGPWVKLRLTDPDQLDPFLGMQKRTQRIDGDALKVVIAIGEATEVPMPEPDEGKPDYGDYAQALRLSGFVLNPEIWPVLGSDSDYQSWVRNRKCVGCGWKPVQVMDEFIRCEFAHVRRVSRGSGVGIKPGYSGIPLCGERANGCHGKQHQKGESAIAPNDEIDRIALQHVEQWAWERLRRKLGVSRMRFCRPDKIQSFAKEHGLFRELPAVIRHWRADG